MLTLPSEVYIAEQLDSVDPQRVHAAREAMQAAARDARCATTGSGRSRRTRSRGGYSPDPVSAGRRALANLALAMLCLDARAQSGDAVWPGRAYQRFKDAGNMTDRQGALTGADRPRGSMLAEPALERFHAMFRNDAAGDRQVVRAAGQRAGARRPRVRARQAAARATRTSRSPIPNRARSLIGTFCLGNPAAFHRADGAGYVFWADRVLALDAINPQLASRIARALDRWSQLAEPYRARRARRSRGSPRSAELSDDTQRDRVARLSQEH